jgi:protein-L-isoaspartate(D-aspartate) O-methyltransferase
MDLDEQNKKLVEYLKARGYLKSKKLERALLKTPRHLFVPQNLLEYAYRDIPLPIGFGQTISQPSTVVIMTEMLDVKPGQKVLEIGAGSGWQAAILSRLVGSKGRVYTVEIIRGLVEFAKKNLQKLNIKNVEVIHADGSRGLPEKAPFDRIIITAATPKISEVLLQQLKINGKLVAPVGSAYMQKMVCIEKTEKGYKKSEYEGYFVFVPLRGKYGFREDV